MTTLHVEQSSLGRYVSFCQNASYTERDNNLLGICEVVSATLTYLFQAHHTDFPPVLLMRLFSIWHIETEIRKPPGEGNSRNLLKNGYHLSV